VKDHYATLGISTGVSPDEIREQYRRLVALCHPDKFLDLEQKARAEEKIKKLNEAYEVLSDPARRASYDRRRAKASSRRRGASRVRSERTVPGWRSPVTPLEDLTVTPGAAWNVVDYLHYVFSAMREDVLEVRLGQGANVILLDDLNYARYRAGIDFHFWGGYAQESPVALPVPYSGIWHLVVDLGGFPGTLRASAKLIRRGWF
jgi:hypothetical protein